MRADETLNDIDLTPYAGTNRIRFYGTLSACALCGQAPRSIVKCNRARPTNQSSTPEMTVYSAGTADLASCRLGQQCWHGLCHS